MGEGGTGVLSAASSGGDHRAASRQLEPREVEGGKDQRALGEIRIFFRLRVVERAFVPM